MTAEQSDVEESERCDSCGKTARMVARLQPPGTLAGLTICLACVRWAGDALLAPEHALVVLGEWVVTERGGDLVEAALWPLVRITGTARLGFRACIASDDHMLGGSGPIGVGETREQAEVKARSVIHALVRALGKALDAHERGAVERAVLPKRHVLALKVIAAAGPERLEYYRARIEEREAALGVAPKCKYGCTDPAPNPCAQNALDMILPDGVAPTSLRCRCACHRAEGGAT